VENVFGELLLTLFLENCCSQRNFNKLPN